MSEQSECILGMGAVLLAVTLVMLASGMAAGAEGAHGSPITAKLVRSGGFATFTNRLHPDNRIGYRFWEHTPIVHGQIPKGNEDAGIDPAEVGKLERSFSARPGALSAGVRVEGEGWVPQQWTFHMAPAADGIDLLLVVETGSRGLNAYYGIQQCFRMSGKTNQKWRRAIAETPAFSEYDLWHSLAADKAEKVGLTHVLRKGKWDSVEAAATSVGARTPLGVRIDRERSGRDIAAMPKVGPYEARMLAPIDCGLITRANREGTWVCGIFWERTSHVTDHHPADCLHSIVNIGGVPPNAKRAVRGKIYWFKGTLDELTKRWRRDFTDARVRV